MTHKKSEEELEANLNEYDAQLLDDPSIRDLLASFEAERKARAEERLKYEETVECKHPKCIPAFDKEAAEQLKDAYEVRKHFPRFWGTCSDCGRSVIAYASYEHYLLGDW